MPIMENKDKGYISLYRSIQEHYLYPNHRTFTEFEAWVDMLLLANHKEAYILVGIQKVKIGRGEFITSELKLSIRWMWGRDRVRNFLKLLVNDKMIFKKSSSKFTMITVCNYDDYQSSATAKQQQGNNKATTRQQQADTNNNDNNDNNGNNDYDGVENPTPTKPKKSVIEQNKESFNDRKQEFWEECLTYQPKYCREMIEDFYRYWFEPNAKYKMKKEMQKTWFTAGRLATWYKRANGSYDEQIKKQNDYNRAQNSE